MKWLAGAGAAVLIVLGVLLWQATREGSARPVADDPTPEAAPPIDAAPPAPPVAVIDAAPPAVDGEPGVFALKSEEFWDRVDEYPRQLRGMTAECYKGGQDRKAKLKVSYQLSIDHHVVTLRNIKVVTSTLTDNTLEACMLRMLETARFDDREMPDFLSPDNDPEDLLIRIENFKRFLPHTDEGLMK